MVKKIDANNYMVIQGWMITELGLKGNELIIYAIIYGFSQAEGTKFSGSLQYLADWCNSTRQGVLKTLKKLVDKNLITKEDKVICGVKLCSYVVNKVEWGVKQSLTGYTTEFNGGVKQSLHNNIIDNIDINIYINILSYLNSKTGKKFKHTSNKTRKLIQARFNDGFKEDDFYVVIDNKCADWLNDSKMNKYLCPETLFGTKFEKYLNQGVVINERCTRDGKDQFGNTVL